MQGKAGTLRRYYSIWRGVPPSSATVNLKSSLPQETNTSKYLFVIDGMTCGSCVSMVEHTIKEEVPGVNSVAVNLTGGIAVVNINNDAVARMDTIEKQIVTAVENVGFKASPSRLPQSKVLSDTRLRVAKELSKDFRTLLVSAGLTTPLFTISMGEMWFDFLSWSGFRYVQLALATPVVFYCGKKFFVNAYKLALKKKANMDTLVSIGAGASYILSMVTLFQNVAVTCHTPHLYFESAAMIVSLVLVGKYLERKASFGATEAIHKLAELQPVVAHIKREDKFEKVPVEQVQVNDLVMVKAGERIPLDSSIVDGSSFVNENIISGETVPVEKTTGDTVFAGTINAGDSPLILQVTKGVYDSKLSHIIKAVESAQTSKPAIQRLTDTVSGLIVPTVLLTASTTFGFWYLVGRPIEFGLMNALSVMVIACPCALGLATPIAVSLATSEAAKHGALVKNAESLERIGTTNVVVFDKTGTLTTGSISVENIFDYTGTGDTNRVLYLAGCVEFKSPHPIAKAIVESCKHKSIQVENSTFQFWQYIRGLGVVGKMNGGNTIMAGNIQLLLDNNVSIDPSIRDKIKELSQKGCSYLLVAENNTLVGLIVLMDAIRSEASESVDLLQKMGVDVAMVTGDNALVAHNIAKQIGIKSENVFCQVSPEGKADLIRTHWAGKSVAMVGDGVNDVVGLAAANTSIAMGTGTDIATEAADITMTREDLRTVPNLVLLSRKAISNIKQNLFLSFAYNIVAIPVAAYGLLNPMIAAAAMSASSLCVVTNSLRLKNVKLLPFSDKKVESRDKQEEVVFTVEK